LGFRLFLFVFMLLMFFLFILNCIFSNVFFWWRVFILITLTFVFLSKVELLFSNVLNYFLLQEFLGLIFLLTTGALVQYLFLLIKVGVSPLHFWIFSVVNNLTSNLVVWFLTFQKLPFLPVLVSIFSIYWSAILVLGVFICSLQLFLIKYSKFMFVISSTESFNWILLGLFLGIWGANILFIYYMLNMFFLLSPTSHSLVEFVKIETYLVFLNMPLTVIFFVKLFRLKVLRLYIDFYTLVLLLTLFMSSLSILVWMLSYSLRKTVYYENSFNSWRFLIYPLGLILFF